MSNGSVSKVAFGRFLNSAAPRNAARQINLSIFFRRSVCIGRAFELNYAVRTSYVVDEHPVEQGEVSPDPQIVVEKTPKQVTGTTDVNLAGVRFAIFVEVLESDTWSSSRFPEKFQKPKYIDTLTLDIVV